MNKLHFKKSVLHIIIKTSHDGAAVYPVRLCDNMKEYDQTIISCFKGNAFEEILAKGIKCENLINSDNISYKYLLLKYWKFIKYLRKNSFDIIHYHNGGIGLIVLSIWLRRKEIIIFHLHSGNVIGDASTSRIPFIHKLILKYLKDKIITIAVAYHVFNKFEISIGTKKNLILIPNAVPFNFKKKNYLNNSIGYIGREEKLKGYYAFKRIADELVKCNKLVHFYEMGNFTKSQKKINQLRPSFNVEWFYRKIDLLIFLSTANEGLPLTILEALSFDVGVICYPVDGAVEILGKDYPLLISSENEALQKINKFYSNEFDREELSKIHSERSVKFNFNKMINQLKQIYE
jgi:glycosyltransferase involved in cell wall biosynthesis